MKFNGSEVANVKLNGKYVHRVVLNGKEVFRTGKAYSVSGVIVPNESALSNAIVSGLESYLTGQTVTIKVREQIRVLGGILWVFAGASCAQVTDLVCNGNTVTFAMPDRNAQVKVFYTSTQINSLEV